MSKGKANEPRDQAAVTLDVELNFAKGTVPRFNMPLRMKGRVALDLQPGEPLWPAMESAFARAFGEMTIDIPETATIPAEIKKPRRKKAA